MSQLAAGQEGSLPTQRHKVTLAAELGGFEIVEWFDDPDISAFSGKRRPGYEQMMGRLPEIRGGAIIFYRLDRFCRRLSQFTHAWEQCQRHDVALISATEPIDTASPIGLAMMEILMVFAQLEARTTQVRLRDHHATLAADGRYPGGPNPLGWTYDPAAKEVALDPAGALAVKAMVNAALSGMSAHRIAECLNDGMLGGTPVPMLRGRWDHSGVLRLLRSPRLVGDRVHKGTITARDAFPAIVDRATFAKLQAVLRTRRPGRPPAPLTGLVICGSCGQPMRAGSGAVRSYCCLHPPCVRKSGVSCTKLERHVRVLLAAELADKGLGARLAAARRRERSATPGAAERATVERSLLRLEAGWVDGNVSDATYVPKRRELLARLAALDALTPVSAPMPTVTDLRAVARNLELADGDQLRRIFHACVAEVVIPPKQDRRPHDLTTIRPAWRW